MKPAGKMWCSSGREEVKEGRREGGRKGRKEGGNTHNLILSRLIAHSPTLADAVGEVCRDHRQKHIVNITGVLALMFGCLFFFAFSFSFPHTLAFIQSGWQLKGKAPLAMEGLVFVICVF